jgi:alpha-L-arabinofuranosidase
MAKPKDVVKQIRKATRRKFSAEEKIRIVLEGLRGEIPTPEICRREGIAPSVYYKWSKGFLEAGKIHISICNINPNEGATVRCEIRGADFKKVSGSILTAPKMNTHNTFDNPDAIKPAKFDNVKIKGNELVIKMPSKSIVVLEIE